MGTPKVANLVCPSCGANLPTVPAGATSLECRFCQNVVTIEREAPPPERTPEQAADDVARYERKLYLDPEAQKAVRDNTKFTFIALAIFILGPLVIIALVFFGPDVYHSIRPYPRTCDDNDEIYASGDWQGTTPILEKVGANCRVHITKSKLEGSVFVTGAPINLEIWIEDSTIETTDAMMQFGLNPKVHIKNSTLTSAKDVIDARGNLELDLAGSTLESKGDIAVNASWNAKPTLDNSHLRANRIALNADLNLELVLKNGSDITSAGVAVKGADNTHVTSEGGKLDGGDGAISSATNLVVKGTKLVLNSKGKAIWTNSNLALDLTDSALTSTTDSAVAATENANLTLANTTVSGATAITLGLNSKVNASTKTHLVGTAHDAIDAKDNATFTFSDTQLAGAEWALKVGDRGRITLETGSAAVGRQGGIFAGSDFVLTGDGAIDGGSGPGITARNVAQFGIPTSMLKGNPPTASH